MFLVAFLGYHVAKFLSANSPLLDVGPTQLCFVAIESILTAATKLYQPNTFARSYAQPDLSVEREKGLRVFHLGSIIMANLQFRNRQSWRVPHSTTGTSMRNEKKAPAN